MRGVVRQLGFGGWGGGGVGGGEEAGGGGGKEMGNGAGARRELGNAQLDAPKIKSKVYGRFLKLIKRLFRYLNKLFCFVNS